MTLFGYVKISKGDLLVRDYETYRGIYCGLCKSLGRRYTVFSRFLLHYDFAFYAVLRMALEEKEPAFCREGCLFNPLCRKKCCRKNEALDRAADALILTSYFKLTDNITDSSFPKKGLYRLLRRLIRPMAGKARKNNPDLWKWLEEYINRQQEAECSADEYLDRAAEPTAVMMSRLLSSLSAEEATARILRELGYNMGKWIYWMDAADDLQEDIQKKNFNPFASEYNIDRKNYAEKREQCGAEAQMLLTTCINEAAKALDLLSVTRYEMILKNIVYIGMPVEQTKVLSRLSGTSCKRKEKKDHGSL